MRSGVPARGQQVALHGHVPRVRHWTVDALARPGILAQQGRRRRRQQEVTHEGLGVGGGTLDGDGARWNLGGGGHRTGISGAAKLKFCIEVQCVVTPKCFKDCCLFQSVTLL